MGQSSLADVIEQDLSPEDEEALSKVQVSTPLASNIDKKPASKPATKQPGKKTLDELILTMGDMLQFKNYDPKDPMNSKAAAWAMRNKHRFPIDDRELKGATSWANDIVIGMSEDADDLDIKIL